MVNKGSEIDFDRLTNAIIRKNLSFQKVIEKLGLSRSYFSGVKATSRMSNMAITSLEAVCGISYDEIKPIQKTEAVEEKTSTVKEDYETIKDDLYKLIYSGVYEAVKKAWSE